MKTPDEIKKGLECCSQSLPYPCSGCPYERDEQQENAWRCDLDADALAYIQQLEAREWDLFDLLSSAWFGKRCYFQQEDGTVYSRSSGEYMSFDQAIDEFAHELTFERESSGEDIKVPSWIRMPLPARPQEG